MSDNAISSTIPHPRVTVIGLGAMGSAVANAFVEQQYPVTGCNRTPQKAYALCGKGAKRAETIAEAIGASTLVVACVLDYPVLRELLTQGVASLGGRTVVNLTTGSPTEAREMSAWI